MLQPQSWGEEYSLHTSKSVVGEFARREFAFRLPSTASLRSASFGWLTPVRRPEIGERRLPAEALAKAGEG